MIQLSTNKANNWQNGWLHWSHKFAMSRWAAIDKVKNEEKDARPAGKIVIFVSAFQCHRFSTDFHCRNWPKNIVMTFYSIWLPSVPNNLGRQLAMTPQLNKMWNNWHSATMSLHLTFSGQWIFASNGYEWEWDEWGQFTYLVIFAVHMNKPKYKFVDDYEAGDWPRTFVQFAFVFSSFVSNLTYYECCVFSLKIKKEKKLNRNYTFCASSHINHQKKIKYKSGQWHIASAIGRESESKWNGAWVHKRRNSKKKTIRRKIWNGKWKATKKMAHIYHFIILFVYEMKQQFLVRVCRQTRKELHRKHCVAGTTSANVSMSWAHQISQLHI